MAAPLDPRQRAFCQHYARIELEVGRPNGRAAAIAAGYSKSSAANQSVALLKRADVIGEIAIQKARLSQGMTPLQGRLTNGGGEGPPPLEGQVLGPSDPGPRRAPPVMSDEEKLTRQFLVSEALRNLQFCMGDAPVKVSKVVKREVVKDGKTVEVWEGEEISIFERDAAGANTALAFLDKQLDKLRTEGVDPIGQVPAEQRRRIVEGAMAEKLAALKQFVPQETTP